MKANSANRLEKPISSAKVRPGRDEALASSAPAGLGSRMRSLPAKILLLGIMFLFIMGCGRAKEELEAAKKQIDSLSADVKRLTDVSTGLENDKKALQEEVAALTQRNRSLGGEVEGLKKSRSNLQEDNAGLKKKLADLQTELDALKRKNADLAKELGDLKSKSQAPAVSPPPMAPIEKETPGAAAPPPAGSSPCRVLVEYMKKAGDIVRRNRGAERDKMLERNRQDYAERLKAAPEKAVKAAEAWIKEMLVSWDKPGDDAIFNLLRKRNEALDACGLTPSDAGF